MTDRFPLLVGVTGKREFSEDAQANDRLAQAVADRLRATFNWLDRKFPNMPKVLLSGGALGTDLLAVDEALRGRSDWSVVLVLPYNRKLFEKDFPSDSPMLKRFQELTACGGYPRVQVRELPPLRTEAGQFTTETELKHDRAGHASTPRHNHYEQVGQFIAETAMILIGVMDDSTRANTSQANGATSRIVAFRRAGRADPAGEDVARRSQLLGTPASHLMRPPAGLVWLIEPRKPPPWPDPPVRALPPLTDRSVERVYAGLPGADMPIVPEHEDFIERAWTRLADRCFDLRDQLVGDPIVSMRGVERAFFFESLRLPLAFRRFQQSRDRQDRKRRKREKREKGEHYRVTSAIETRPTPATTLNRLRRSVSDVQQTVSPAVTWCFRLVATLFVLAVATLEGFAKLAPHVPEMLFGYVGALIAIGLLVFVVERRRWQPVAEDYRSVAEMCRVQAAWWAAGLPDRVDRIHLQGADRDLSGSRDAARSMLNWIWLRSSWKTAKPEELHWTIVRNHTWQGLNGKRPTRMLAAAPREIQPSDWIGSQIRYYARNHEARERRIHKREIGTWFLFIGSGCLAAILTVLLSVPSLFDAVNYMVAGPCRFLVVIGGTLLALACLVIRLYVPHRSPLLRALETWVLAGAAASCLAIALAALATSEIWHYHHDGATHVVNITDALHGSHVVAPSDVAHNADVIRKSDVAHTFQNLTIVTFVVLTALAGAIRFLTEKFGLEAEALAYRDALGKFEAAERILATNWDSATNEPACPQSAQALVRELGIQALRENETWLRSHRERPLSPVIG